MLNKIPGLATVLSLVVGLASVTGQGAPVTTGQAPLNIHQAAQAGDAATVAALLRTNPGLIASTDDTGRTPLLWACRGVHLGVVRLLVERGADVNALDGSRIAPLHSVASRGHLEAASLLVARGARLDARMADGATPLHLAARNGHAEVAGWLFEKGAPLDARDGSEDSPLHAAARADKWTVVELLAGRVPAKRVAVLNVRDFDGSTVLHLASRSGRTDTVARLASQGADLDFRNTLGQTAYNLAEQGGFTELTALLAQKGADRRPSQSPRLTGPYLGQTPPGLTPQIFAKGIVSTRDGVYGTIVFSPDHREAFWKPESGSLLFMRTEGGVWSVPRVFPFTARPAIDVPFFSIDGRRLYFMTGTRSAVGMAENEAIWFVERTSDGWSAPRSFDPIVNSVPMHWQFSMDERGNVYLSTDGGIAFARFERGRYLPPEKLPAPVNVPHTAEEKYRAGEVGPFISRKGDHLIFTKFGTGIGLWITFKQRDGSWSEPRNLSERLGGVGNDSAAQVTPDGKYLFFQSVRPGSAPSRSFYWVDARFIESLRPSPLLAGTFRRPVGPLLAAVLESLGGKRAP